MSANHESVLWIAECLHPHGHYVFRTRKAARDYVAKQARPGSWAIYRAKWGPDA
jgi:hypothetical protein